MSVTQTEKEKIDIACKFLKDFTVKCESGNGNEISSYLLLTIYYFLSEAMEELHQHIENNKAENALIASTLNKIILETYQKSLDSFNALFTEANKG